MTDQTVSAELPYEPELAPEVLVAGEVALVRDSGTDELAALAEAIPSETPTAGGHSVRRNLGALAGGQLVTWTMTLIWTLVVPRIIGPVGVGLIASSLAAAGVLSILLGFGTRAYVVRESVVDPEGAPKLIGTAIVLRVLVAPLVGLGAVLFAHFAGYGHEARVVLYLATLMTIFGLVAEPMQAGFQAIERMEYLAYTDVINKTAQSLVGIALALVGLGAVGIISDMTVAAGVLILLNAYWLRRFLRVDLRTSARMIRRVFRGSLVYWATGTFSMIYLWIDTLMLSLITHPRQVGWYGVTTNLFQTFLFVPVMVSTAWLPRLVSAFAGGKDRVVEAARAPLELVLVIGIPLASLITMASPLMIHLLYGPAYGHAVPVMIVLAACLPWMSLNIILSSIFVAMKRASVWTFVMVGAALVNPLFNLVLIPATVNRFHNGAIGAGAALVLTELLMDLVGMALIGRQVLSRSSLTRWLTATLVSAAALVPAFLTRGLGSGASLAIGATVLIALLIPCRVVTVEQLTFLRSMAQARWRRLRGRGGPGLAVAND